MKCFEWLNKQVGDYDVFLITNKKESEIIVNHFNSESAKGCKSNTKDEWYYFLNIKKRTITPMPELSLAFGGQYNDESPYGRELVSFDFNINEFYLQTYNFL